MWIWQRWSEQKPDKTLYEKQKTSDEQTQKMPETFIITYKTGLTAPTATLSSVHVRLFPSFLISSDKYKHCIAATYWEMAYSKYQNRNFIRIDEQKTNNEKQKHCCFQRIYWSHSRLLNSTKRLYSNSNVNWINRKINSGVCACVCVSIINLKLKIQSVNDLPSMSDGHQVMRIANSILQCNKSCMDFRIESIQIRRVKGYV